jgi:hypothetical protein
MVDWAPGLTAEGEKDAVIPEGRVPTESETEPVKALDAVTATG